MSVPLKNYKTSVDGLRFQLVENWCLCKYCQVYDFDNVNFSYWLRDLKTCISNLKFLDIKNGISKERILKSMLISDYDYNDSSMINRIAIAKFKKENITDSEKIDTVCAEFANNVTSVIEVISDNAITVEEYLESTFGFENRNIRLNK